MAYNNANSLNPMMFKKQHLEQGTMNERCRSKSMDLLNEVGYENKRGKAAQFRSATTITRQQSEPGWKEIKAVKSQNPVITCLLPALSLDFVASSLLAVGATPLITEGIFIVLLYLFIF